MRNRRAGEKFPGCAGTSVHSLSSRSRTFRAGAADLPPIEPRTQRSSAIASSRETPAGASRRAISKARSRACRLARSCIQPCSSHSRIARPSAAPRSLSRAVSGSRAAILSSSASWSGPRKMMRKARQAETGSHMSEWLRSPRLAAAEVKRKIQVICEINGGQRDSARPCFHNRHPWTGRPFLGLRVYAGAGPVERTVNFGADLF
ncbi:hypothetical protein ABIA94_008500 [Bradyrhizobium sp. LA7.1]